MQEIELNERSLALLNLFEAYTGVMPIEVEELDETIFFMVPFSQLGRAIGKKGENVKKLEKKLGKKVVIIAYSKDPKQFVKNVFNNVKIYQVDVVDVMGEKEMTLIAEEKDKAKLLGKNKARLRNARELMKRLFNISLHVRTKRVV